jgi:hypothetical protein
MKHSFHLRRALSGHPWKLGPAIAAYDLRAVGLLVGGDRQLLATTRSYWQLKLAALSTSPDL